MQNIFESYIQSVSKKFAHTATSEMGYRKEFEILLENIFDSIKVKRIDHDAKAIDGNKPDFIVHKFNIPILYIEVKDIGIDLNKVEKSEQMARYFGYTNLILTDYVEFRFYRNGIPYGDSIKIANYDIKKRTIEPIPLNYEFAKKTIVDFTESKKEPIRSGKHLSQIMGGKAQRIRDNVRQYLSVESEKNASIKKVYEAIKKQLVHDLTLNAFADMYAQTLVYGLFVARYHDDSPDNFNRREARDLVPASNPLLKHFFDHIVGTDFDKRLEFIVDELCEVFLHSNVVELMKEYYKIDMWEKKHEAPDPVIHFYEDFLKEYDPELRKKLGAFYTPLPVVRFITRSVDYILQKDFNLPSGLADTSKLPNGKHRVQILDPAAGTGTFISAVIRIIYQRLMDTGQKGRWTSYVHNDLLPRLHGFEIMMAPYTIAHLKLSMAFKETGFKYFNRRLGIYLTNSLEESDIKDDLFSGEFGFAGSIAEESREASKIKNQTPIMVVLGNPPYSISSSNKGNWILDLIKVYKKDLNEKKINLDDDYIKFIRFAEHFIEKNKSGIVAMITNNSFIDGITHRQMRKHLLETFDNIYILDLHGNSKKKEKSPDGSKDENVFDIMQGVSINIFVKSGKEKTSLGKIYHSELYGLREDKFKSLNESDIHNIKWNKLNYCEPYYFFVPRNTGLENEYEMGFKIDKLMEEYNSGIQTKNDSLSMIFSEAELDTILKDFQESTYDQLRAKYILKDTSGWNVKKAKDSLNIDFQKANILYRPFDIRNSILQKQSGGFIGRSRYNTAKHFLKYNLGIITVRQQSTFDFQHILVSKFMIESGAISLQTKEWGYIFPLYLYSDDGTKVPNLKQEIVSQISEKLGITFTNKKNSPPLEGYAKRGVVNDSHSIEKSNSSIEILTHINGTPIKRNFVKGLPYNIKLEPRTKELRKAGILSEVLFWKQVNKGKFYKIDFDRQRIIGNYIVDFYVKALGLIVEIDGSSHDLKIDYDAERQAYLESLNLKVYRINDLAVKKDINAVMVGLEEFIIKSYGLLTTPSAEEHGIHPSKGEDYIIKSYGLLTTPSAEEHGIHPSKGGELKTENTFTPEDILDYIYAVLHSPNYREKYKEFLKIDFPRVPYPKDKNTFKKLVALGNELRSLHLLESPKVNQYITSYPIEGTDTVEKISFEKTSSEKPPSNNGKVYINQTQYFGNVPEIAWNLYIGGYQPSQKWLKDRKGRTLTNEDIEHYQKIIVALTETDRIMKEIDNINIQ